MDFHHFLLLVIVFSAVGFSSRDGHTSSTSSLSPPSADWEYVVRKSKEGIAHPPMLILLHGYGSNEQDLFSFAPLIPDNWVVISVRGRISQGNNRYCWYNVAMENGKIAINFSEEEESRKQLIAFIDKMRDTYKVDTQKVVVAGFSQGAVMSLNISLTAPEKVTGFACFSGRMIEEIEPLVSSSPSVHSLSAFIAHESEDKMLPLQYAKQNIENLQKLGVTPVFVEDKVAHSISSKQLDAFVQWLSQL